jgi:hypothetical protein
VVGWWSTGECILSKELARDAHTTGENSQKKNGMAFKIN